ncbi:MAG TPA: hypothetical protein VFF33_12575 [Ignavibacteriaceae bacterium]|nr:hypothetical protein [Ignavibacteriaceae bacterium]
MFRIKKVLLLIIIFTFSTFAYQEENTSEKFNVENDDSLKERSFYTGLNIGLIEYASIHIGYQISQRYSVSLIGGGSIINGGIFANAQGVGVRFSYHTKGKYWDCYTIKYVPYIFGDFYNPLPKQFFFGNYIDITVGKENIYNNGFNIYWSLGISYNNAKTMMPLFCPLFKFGVNYNIM